MPKNESTGLEVLTQILADAVAGGAEAVELEYESGGQLEVMFISGSTGGGYLLGRELGRAIMATVYEQNRKNRGKLRLTLHGRDYIVQVKRYDSFGETAYRLTFRLAKR